jgi:hypothetical protein
VELDSNWVSNLSTPPILLTGRMYGSVLDKENWTSFLPSFELKVTGPFALLRRTMQNLQLLIGPAESFGVLQVLERVTEHGKKPESMLIANLHAPSFGTVTEIRQMLLWTNFEELSTLGISSLGSTSILSHWKLKGRRSQVALPKCGSVPISTQPTGSKTSTTKPMEHFCED